MVTVVNKKYHEAYGKLVRRFPIRPIRNEKENELAAQICDTLVNRDDLSQAEQDYLEVLTETIVKFESEAWQHEDLELAPRELIQLLMDENGLVQKDLAPLFGTPIRVSEFLSGQRKLSVEQAKRLADRFKLKLDALLK